MKGHPINVRITHHKMERVISLTITSCCCLHKVVTELSSHGNPSVFRCQLCSFSSMTTCLNPIDIDNAWYIFMDKLLSLYSSVSELVYIELCPIHILHKYESICVLKDLGHSTCICKWMNKTNLLTHWGRVTHICVGNLPTIGSDNGLSPDRRQAIIWTSAGILLIGP